MDMLLTGAMHVLNTNFFVQTRYCHKAVTILVYVFCKEDVVDTKNLAEKNAHTLDVQTAICKSTGPTAHANGDKDTRQTPALFFDRELSWLAFNNRVLTCALEQKAPILEQLKFLAIFYNNLDEFFMVRVARILCHPEQSHTQDCQSNASLLSEIRKHTLHLLEKAETYWNKKLCRQLAEYGVRFTRYESLAKKQQKILDDYFRDEVYPLLTPQAIDSEHPIPVISSLSLNFLVELADKKGHTRYARLKCPNTLSRFLYLSSSREQHTYASLGVFSASQNCEIVFLEDLIMAHLPRLFPGHKIKAVGFFRLTRRSDLEIGDENANDFLHVMKDLVDQRRFSDVIRLEVTANTPDSVVAYLSQQFSLTNHEVYRMKGPLAFSALLKMCGAGRVSLRYKHYVPVIPPVFKTEETEKIFSAIRKKDQLLFHPYDSFFPVHDFIRRAAADPHVIAIKQTLYRTGNDSPIVQALIEARRLGKQVTAVVELKARFDEEQNITWAEELEKAGVHVVYGLPGMKIHAKLCLVVREEKRGVRRYAHIGTGNYNVSSAKIYTDLGLFTAHPGICADVSDLFNVMTGYADKTQYEYLWVSPCSMRSSFLQSIEDEIQSHALHGNGKIIFKCNQLVDKECIEALYKASCAGVSVFLQIRGVCCLRPHVKGVSQNIHVSSIVGRYLEHARVFYFHNNGDYKIFMGSADIMPRNLDRRIEVMTPLLDAKVRTCVYKQILEPHLADTENTFILQSNGKYLRKRTPLSHSFVEPPVAAITAASLLGDVSRD